MRLDDVPAWQHENERPYLYEKAVSVASWKQAAGAEWASGSGALEYVSTLLELVKLFERVPHDWLVLYAHS